MATQHKTVRTDAIQTPTIRGVWYFLHEKKTLGANRTPIPADKQKYEFVGLIPKLDRDATKCANYLLFANLAMSLVPQVPEWNGQYPAGGNWPIKDGDQKAAQYPFMAGHWTINFSSNFPPKVALLQNGKPVDIPSQRMPNGQDAYKSGDYCVVSTYAFSYDNIQRGVKFDMEGVCFVGAGEAVGGHASRSVNEIFGNINATVPAGAAPMPTAQGYAQPGPTAPAPQPQAYAPPSPPVAPVAPAAPAPTYAAPPMPPAAPPMPPAAPPMPPVGGAPALPPFPPR